MPAWAGHLAVSMLPADGSNFRCCRARDGFDELTAEMNQNQEEYDNTKSNINEEITVINDEKTKHMEVLANTISAINADTEEMNEKDQQKRDLQKDFDKTCDIFREKITEILFTNLCCSEGAQ